MFQKTITILVFAIISVHFTSCEPLPSSQVTSDQDQAKLLVQKVKFHQSCIDKIKSALEKGQSKQIIPLLDAYLNNKSIPCQLKKNFMNVTREILKDRQGQNTFEVNKLKAELNGVDNMPDFYQSQKKELQNLKVEFEKMNYDSEIKLSKEQLRKTNEKFANQSETSNRYLNELKGLQKNNANANKSFDEGALQKLLVQMKGIDELINDTILKREKILQDLTELKLSLLYEQINNLRAGISQKKNEEEYRTNSNLAAEARLKFKTKQDQIDTLKSEIDKLQKSPTLYDMDIDTTSKNLEELRRQKQSGSLQSMGFMMKRNINTIGQRIRSINAECLL